MFFFPYNTDAPIYHYPIATLLLIAVNIGVFVGVTMAVADGSMDHDAYAELCLQFGRVNPLQWITSNFMHAGVFHLGGNMVFLWAFGLVTEGKLGWYRFLPVYLLIGAVQCALEQIGILTLASFTGASAASYSLGASAAIFGVMGMALVWAPKNDLYCVFCYWIGFFARASFVEVSILSFAMWYLVLQVIFFALGGFQIGSEALHLLGFAIGFPLGFVFLKLRWVDCENWDILSVWAGKQGGKTAFELREEMRALAGEMVAEGQAAKGQREQTQFAQAVALLRQYLANHDSEAACAVYRNKLAPSGGAGDLTDRELLALIQCLHHEKLWHESVPLMVATLKRPAGATPALRLRLAQVLIQTEDRPRQALAVLAKLPEALPEAAETRRRQLVRLAHAAVEEGTVELATEDW